MKCAFCVCGCALHQVEMDKEKLEVHCANCGKLVVKFLLTKEVEELET